MKTAKKYLPIIFLFISQFTATSAEAVSLLGNRSCGVWIEARKEDAMMARVHETWLVGFLSGIAFTSNINFIPGTDNSSIYLYIDNYCRKNPLSGLAAGAESLFFELKIKKNLN